NASGGQAAIYEAFKPGTGPNLVTSVIGVDSGAFQNIEQQATGAVSTGGDGGGGGFFGWGGGRSQSQPPPQPPANVGGGNSGMPSFWPGGGGQGRGGLF